MQIAAGDSSDFLPPDGDGDGVHRVDDSVCMVRAKMRSLAGPVGVGDDGDACGVSAVMSVMEESRRQARTPPGRPSGRPRPASRDGDVVLDEGTSAMDKLFPLDAG